MPVQKKPTAARKPLSQSDVNGVLTAYGIKDWQELPTFFQGKKKIEPGVNLGTARKMFIESRGEKFVLKEVPWYCSDKSFVEDATLLQDMLLHRRVPVPQILRTKNGIRYVEASHENTTSLLQLHVMAQGDAWTGRDKEVKATASALADFHSASEELFRHKKVGSAIPLESIFEISKGMLDFAVEECCEKFPQVSIKQIGILQCLMETYRETLEQSEMNAKKAGYFNVVYPVHGDFNQTNLLYRSNKKVAAILDFDNCCIDNPVHDVAQAILHLCFFPFRGHSSKFGNIPSQFNHARAKVFLSEYLAKCSSNIKHMIWENLCPAAVSISIELCTLGIVSGAYPPSSLPGLFTVPRRTATSIEQLAKHMSGNMQQGVAVHGLR